jgi:hypothetical protein
MFGIGAIYWILWVIALIFGAGWGWRGSDRSWIGVGLFSMVMFFLIGWHAFGLPLHG